MERLPGIPALRRLAFNVARWLSYTSCTLELRLFSSETVLTLTPMVLAMKLSEHFFCSNTLIVYLCSEVNCLYICNTKLIYLRGERMFSSFFALLNSSAGLFGGFTPLAARQAPVVFFICQTPLRFSTSIWKEPYFLDGQIFHQKKDKRNMFLRIFL